MHATRARETQAACQAHCRTAHACIPRSSLTTAACCACRDVHEIYYEECGNPKGKPALFVHGGPGAGCDNRARSFFDPDAYRIVLFDQRGCGRSRPHASLVDNTTWHLVADMEQLREHLGIERWLVFGGSWGSTLALAYAQTHPQRVSELVLRGIFMLSQFELRWFYQEGASALFPDRWENYIAAIPPARARRPDPGVLQAPHQRRSRHASERGPRLVDVGGGDQLPARQRREPAQVGRGGVRDRRRAHRVPLLRQSRLPRDARISCCATCRRIRQAFPAVIVQGRYDVVCPMQTAWALHRAWPEADLRVVPDAGHSAFEAGNTHELISATDRFEVVRSRALAPRDGALLVDDPVRQQPAARVVGIAFEPCAARSRGGTCSPRRPCRCTSAARSDSREFVGQQDLQIADGILLVVVAAGIALELRRDARRPCR